MGSVMLKCPYCESGFGLELTYQDYKDMLEGASLLCVHCGEIMRLRGDEHKVVRTHKITPEELAEMNSKKGSEAMFQRQKEMKARLT